MPICAPIFLTHGKEVLEWLRVFLETFVLSSCLHNRPPQWRVPHRLGDYGQTRPKHLKLRIKRKTSLAPQKDSSLFFSFLNRTSFFFFQVNSKSASSVFTVVGKKSSAYRFFRDSMCLFMCEECVCGRKQWSEVCYPFLYLFLLHSTAILTCVCPSLRLNGHWESVRALLVFSKALDPSPLPSASVLPQWEQWLWGWFGSHSTPCWIVEWVIIGQAELGINPEVS